eukprot:CAMPEP_0201523850 /NCGR_PEP_ID=MMETSP0161_2-20130828/20964_1 /ASSEMBLY_ACC=CAM_ASM_000251 /TAXON_ID=180227 /ORGANISM="Neoparamoeba aestuarina, Strain SoJaBio B1-5/56/2" /LENGTH=253 /DNA_ID=CAMNT_0047923079 /DNA_START=35 /DNA_END=793 /DNA_ORIENTATION=-
MLLSYFVYSFDSAGLGKVDKSSLSDQTLIELLFGSCQCQERFRNDDGDFTDVSEMEGIILNDEGRVIEIEMLDSSTGVEKTTLAGELHLEWLPSSLHQIDLAGNNCSGVFDCRFIPLSTRIALFENNLLTGSVDLEVLLNLEVLVAGWNRLSGTIDFTKFPQKLIVLHVSHNSIGGQVDLRGIGKPIAFETFAVTCSFLNGDDVSRDTVHMALGDNQFEGDIRVQDCETSVKDFRVFENLQSERIVDETGAFK